MKGWGFHGKRWLTTRPTSSTATNCRDRESVVTVRAAMHICTPCASYRERWLYIYRPLPIRYGMYANKSGIGRQGTGKRSLAGSLAHRQARVAEAAGDATVAPGARPIPGEGPATRVLPLPVRHAVPSQRASRGEGGGREGTIRSPAQLAREEGVGVSPQRQHQQPHRARHRRAAPPAPPI